MLPINRKISNYNHSSRNGNSIKYIVEHYTGNLGDTAKNNVDYFYGGNRNASAHYFVDDNSIWQSVEDSNAAWSVGDGRGAYGITNQNSISIEMCCQSNGQISEATEKNALELTRYLMNKYNVPADRVVRHYDASRKACPNWSANNWSRWINFKNKLGSTVASAPSNPVSNYNPHVKDWQSGFCKVYYSIGVDGLIGNETRTAMRRAVLKRGSRNCLVGFLQARTGSTPDNIFGPDTERVLINFQRNNQLDPDGIAGYNTWNKIFELYR